MPCGITPLPSQKDARWLQTRLACKGIANKQAQSHFHKHTFHPQGEEREKEETGEKRVWKKQTGFPFSQHEENSKRNTMELNSPMNNERKR